ncbi:MAG: LolA-related protein [Ramlibacter sp.]
MIRLLLLAAGFILAIPAAAANWDVDALMRALAQNKVSRATFVEKKYLAMLDSPATSSGELLFTAPDRLERRTLKPRPESIVLEGGTMTLVRGQRQMVLRLDEYPAIAALTESVRGTLAGDRVALERHYTLQVEGGPSRWSLLLVPKEPRTRAFVLQIRIDGDRGDVRTVEIEQSDKDRSVMTIQKVVP